MLHLLNIVSWVVVHIPCLLDCFLMIRSGNPHRGEECFLVLTWGGRHRDDDRCPCKGDADFSHLKSWYLWWLLFYLLIYFLRQITLKGTFHQLLGITDSHFGNEVFLCQLLLLLKNIPGTPQVVHWLRLRIPNAGDSGLIPGQGTRSHMLQLRVQCRN